MLADQHKLKGPEGLVLFQKSLSEHASDTPHTTQASRRRELESTLVARAKATAREAEALMPEDRGPFLRRERRRRRRVRGAERALRFLAVRPSKTPREPDQIQCSGVLTRDRQCWAKAAEGHCRAKYSADPRQCLADAEALARLRVQAERERASEVPTTVFPW